MTFYSDRPVDQLKLEARRFQETLRAALATTLVNPTKLKKEPARSGR